MMYICCTIASLGSAGEVIHTHVLKGFLQHYLQGPFFIFMVAVLYSHQQKCFHIELVDEYIQNNIRCIVTKSVNQFELVGIADNYEQGDQLIRSLSEKFNW